MLPQKIEALRKATIFNKKTREYAINEIKKDKSYLYKCLKEDIKANTIFRNYNDYLISCILERDGIINRLKPIKKERIFNSKEFLKIYLDDLEKIPNEYKINKIGVFDTETTDIYGYIISYAIVIEKLQSGEIKEIYEFLNPQAKISQEAYSVHKIDQSSLNNKPTFSEKKEEILNYLNSLDMLVGHNVFYDLGVLKRELERDRHFPNILDIPIFDTMFYSWDIVVLEKKKQPKLEEAVEFFLGKQEVKYHDALEDVKMTLKVFKKLLEFK